MASTGDPVTKSARKKLQKDMMPMSKQQQQQQRQQSSNHDTDVANNQSTQATANNNDDDNNDAVESTKTKNSPSLDSSFVQLVAGSFGKRQGLEIVSDMGPFCHVIEL
eukprot:CAMPEP_0178841580 /NCGR_PEP_ID=MMETSP0746-20121128/15014_1 /TAXON_ID=913974 /ORGANISM="Nitzschia punctata, Strain CCMP561" /LENGTH=107 /DNA_ID=CAMNT_0020504787 /DNA_START=1 /DNA_END=328 /DNA_ORIENTATION=+